MGTSSSHIVDFATEYRIKGRVHDILRLFSIEFSQAYTQSLVRKTLEDAHVAAVYENGRMLHQAPVSSAILKSGALLKRGDVVKSWRQRFVVVHNEVENFRVDYYDGMDETGKFKGSINCAGYVVEKFNEEECVALGGQGIKLVPRSLRRRTWYIRCLDDNDLESWFLVLCVVCFKSRPIRDADPCIANAFEMALNIVRWRFGIWGKFLDGGQPQERLMELVYDVLDKEHTDLIQCDWPESRAGYMQRLRRHFDATIQSSCETSWLTSSASIRSVSHMIELQVQDFLVPLCEQIAIFKDLISQSIGSDVDRFLKEKREVQLLPIYSAWHHHVLEAFLMAIKMFHVEMKEYLAMGDFTKEKADEKVSSIRWAIDGWTHPIIREVDHYLVQSSIERDLGSLIGPELTVSHLIFTVIDMLSRSMQQALHTFSVFATDIVESEHDQVLAHVFGLFFHDCSSSVIQATMVEILRTVLDVSLDETIMVPCCAIVEPLRERIDSIENPSLAALINLDCMMEEVMTEMETKQLNSIVEGFAADIHAGIARISEELSVPLLNR